MAPRSLAGWSHKEGLSRARSGVGSADAAPALLKTMSRSQPLRIELFLLHSSPPCPLGRHDADPTSEDTCPIDTLESPAILHRVTFQHHISL